ncbi:FAD:protein FMN transferase [Robiginitalea sp. IMCC43444]|uniref:FAD:protein FMN transferase n=1 Tax=Robiginitalea sp. IMCC43444 TaxID=3459121 RepID=UPI0040412D9C
MKKLLLCAFMVTLSAAGQQTHREAVTLMGSNFEITVVADTPRQADQWIELAVTEIRRIEALISSWDPASETSEINRQAGIKPVKVSRELYQLIKRAIGISALTDGAFDISYAAMDRIWKFDGSMRDLPDPKAIEQSVRLVGYKNILLNEKEGTVYLVKKGMKIGFGGIGKGYAADRTKEVLVRAGVPAGIINASGDMNSWGKQNNDKPWQVAITNPMYKTKSYGMLPLQGRAVVTSGDYEKHVTFEGVRYAHIIDPRSGYPSTGIISTTVFAPKAELADALSTAVFVMGIEAGLDRINQIPEVDCIIVDSSGALHTSRGIALNYSR